MLIHFSDNPPIPGRPIRLGVTSTTATISWTVGKCDGGHGLQFFTIRIGSEYHFDYYYSSYYNYISYRYIRGLDAHQMNYTIIGLTANSNYDVSLRAEGQDSSYSHYSNTLTITTLPPGLWVCNDTRTNFYVIVFCLMHSCNNCRFSKKIKCEVIFSE